MATGNNFTTLYGDAVNECLQILGEPEVSPVNFVGAIGSAKKTKRALRSVLRDMQNVMPDEHLQRPFEIEVLRPYDIGDLTADDASGTPILRARIASIVGNLVTFEANVGSFDLTTDFEPLYTANNCMFRFSQGQHPGSETDWYWVDEVQSPTELRLRSDFTGSPWTADTDPEVRAAFTIAQWRHDLPFDFTDPVDAFRPFREADLQPMGINGMVRKMTSHTIGPWGVRTHFSPRFYCIGYDALPSLNPAEDPTSVATSARGPYIYLHPLPASNRMMTLLYRRKPIIPADDAAYDTVVDLPDDLIGPLVYESVSRAKVDIKSAPDEAGFYKATADEKWRQTNERTQTASALAPIQPDMLVYRGFYKRGRPGWGNRMIVEE